MSVSRIKVLMQNRPGTFSQRGGDTVLMEKFSAGLRVRGVEVTVDVEGKADPKQFDLVHLFNFALPDLTRSLAERAQRAGTPFVVTTLYEDIPTFHNQSVAIANLLLEYVQRGQNQVWLQGKNFDARSVAACAPFDNRWTAQNAKLLLSSGSQETANLKRDYANCAPIREICFGHEVAAQADADLFSRQYGVRDYLLCVGRLESRKNQLMLLKALEDSELTVVLAGGGFTYQPAYEAAVKAFKRKGTTLILDKLTPELLASAYAGAKLFCLPSWYELPGLVYLEAAHYGCNVVAGENGTIQDYLAENIFYCDPSDARSIKNAVTAAYYAPVPTQLKYQASAFTWERSCDELCKAYAEVVAEKSPREISTVSPIQNPGLSWNTWGNPAATPAAPATSPEVSPAQELFEQGETLAKRKEFNEALRILDAALAREPNSVRGNRAKGAVLLAQSNFMQAMPYFEKARQFDPADPKSLSGIGMCKMMEQKPQEAYPFFVKALASTPLHMVTLLQLVECSYIIGRFDDLARILQQYVRDNPTDMEMRYCLAGALYKLGRHSEAKPLAQEVVAWNSQHLGANQLLQLINEQEGKSAGKLETPPIALTKSIDSSSNEISAGLSKQAGLNSIDTRLAELEEEKRARNLEKVLREIKEYTNSAALNVEQRERARLIEAEAMVLSGQLNESEAIYKEILAQNPKSARAMCGMGALSANRNDWGAAKQLFEAALEARREYDVALAGIGLCSHRAGNPEVAWNFFLRALRSNPENSRALLGLIELSYSLKRFSELEVALKNYLEMHPGDLDFVYSLAGCYYAQGKEREALEEVGRVTLFKPDHKGAIELRDMIKAGVRNEARQMGV